MIFVLRLQKSSGSERYTSHRTKNELFDIYQKMIRSDIVTAANTFTSFSILAEEIADIPENEQLSMGVRFVETSGNCYTIR